MSTVEKVLVATTSMNYGGAERRVSILCNFLAELHKDVCLCYTGNNRRQSVYKLDDSVKEFFITKPYMLKFGRFMEKINPTGGIMYHLRRIILRQKIKKLKPQLIVAFMLSPAKTMIDCVRGFSIPVVLAIANDVRHKDDDYVIIYKNTFQNVSGIVYQTNEQMRHYNEVFNIPCITKQTVVNNPVWVSDFWDKPRSEDKHEIISVGRLMSQKNYPLLINAFAKVVKKYKDWKLVIYGEGGSRKNLEQQIVDVGLDNNVRLPGVVNNIDEKLHDASIFVLSSKYEGLPNALIEAMCMGLACIVTDFSGGGAQELIVSGKNGIIVPNYDVDALENAIANLIENPRLVKQLGENAKEIRTRLCSDYILNQWLSFLEAVCSNKE